MRHNRDVYLLTRRYLVELNEIHQTSIDQRSRRIRQNVRRFIHTLVEIGRINTDGLFGHSALIRITRRLIVFRKRYTRRQHTENSTRVYFAMGIFRLQSRIDQITVLGFHSNHRVVLFFWVDIFNHRFV